MPIDTRERPRMSATRTGVPRGRGRTRCTRPSTRRALLRRLRVRHFSGELLDEPTTIAGAATDVGIEPTDLKRWMADRATHEALDAEVARAREPLPTAEVLDRSSPTGRVAPRTCPSYEIVRLSDVIASPSPASSRSPCTTSQRQTPSPARPAATRRRPSASASARPDSALATKERHPCDLDVLDAPDELGRVAGRGVLGADGSRAQNGPAPLKGASAAGSSMACSTTASASRSASTGYGPVAMAITCTPRCGRRRCRAASRR